MKFKIGPCLGNGRQAALVEKDGQEHETTVKFAKEGDAVAPGQSLVQLGASDNEGWHDATVLFHNGPAQVATPKYREGYDRIFGKKTEVGVA